MYLRERDFDAIIGRAQNKWAVAGRGGVGLIKAIIAVESEFEPRKKTLSGKYGLMGLTLDVASTLSMGSQGTPVSERDLLEPETNIFLGTQLLRHFYHSLSNPDTFDVIAAYGHACCSLTPDYVKKVWTAFMHYSQLAGEPYSSYPYEAEGVELAPGKFSTEWSK